jgi:hypothetical protein
MKSRPPPPLTSGVGEVPPFAWERRVGRRKCYLAYST